MYILINCIHIDYEENVLAPLARYTVLSMAYNDFRPLSTNTWVDRYLGCVYCQTDGMAKTRCPFGVNYIPPTWTFENGTIIESSSHLLDFESASK